MNKAKELVEMIRSALDDDDNDVLRRRAINACDQLLVVLSAEPGQPMPVPTAPPVAPTPRPTPVMAAAPTPPPPAMQMLDALIAKLKSELPSESNTAEPEPSRELRIPFVPIPSRLGTGS